MAAGAALVRAEAGSGVRRVDHAERERRQADGDERWRKCGSNLYDIEANLCNGTSILAWYLRNNPNDERKALLGYNGCVRGTNTPNCFVYPDKIMRLKYQIQREINAARQRPGVSAAP